MGKIYAGTSGWAYAGWKPDFYPAKLASAKFLGYYGTRLNSVELNYTFRRRVTEKLLSGWITATPADFKFAVKANQSITHVLRLRDASKATLEFIGSLDPLRDAKKLGPVLFQLPPFLKCDLARLEEFLGGLPRGTRAAMEFRHESWFSDDVYKLLRKANVALCQAESEKIETPDVTTADYQLFPAAQRGLLGGRPQSAFEKSDGRGRAARRRFRLFQARGHARRRAVRRGPAERSQARLNPPRRPIARRRRLRMPETIEAEQMVANARAGRRDSDTADGGAGLLRRGNSEIFVSRDSGCGTIRAESESRRLARWRTLLALVEIACGALIVLGLFTRLAAIPLLIDISVAIASTKIPILLGHGYWRFHLSQLSRHGAWAMFSEARTDFSMLLGLVFLLIVGAGPLSLDARR